MDQRFKRNLLVCCLSVRAKVWDCVGKLFLFVLGLFSISQFISLFTGAGAVPLVFRLEVWPVVWSKQGSLQPTQQVKLHLLHWSLQLAIMCREVVNYLLLDDLSSSSKFCSTCIEQSIFSWNLHTVLSLLWKVNMRIGIGYYMVKI